MKQKTLVMENVLRAADTNREFGKCEKMQSQWGVTYY